MANRYSIDFKLKIVKMILSEHISKHEIERTLMYQENHKGSGDLNILRRVLVD